MIHQGKEESCGISHQIVTQTEILTPQYIVAKKKKMQQSENETTKF